MDFIQRIDAECDDEVMKTIKQQYGYALQIGLAFVNLRPKWWILSVIQTTFYVSYNLYFEFLLFKTTILFSEDLNLASQSAHFFVLVLLMFLIMVSYPMNRNKFIDLLKIVGNNYFQYNDFYETDFVDIWHKETKKLKLYILVTVSGYFGVCLIVGVFIGPFIDQYQGFNTEEYFNGVYMKTPIPMWFPYIIDNIYAKVITTLSQYLIGCMLVGVIVSADLILIFQSVDILLQMRILRNSIKNLETRAVGLYNRWNGTTVKNGKEISKDDKVFIKALNFCVKENVQHHRIVSRAFYDIYSLGMVPLTTAFLVGSAIIALSLFNFITSNKLRIAPQIFSLMLLFGEVANMAIICWVGQELSDLSDGVSQDLYDINWMDWHKDVNLSIMIMKENLKRPLALMAAGITPINMNMFTSIMNSAYSYLNLLLAGITEK